MKLKKLLILPVLLAVFLSSCTQNIKNSADEIRLNSWSVKLKNGSKVTLSFNEDIGSFKVNSKDKSACVKIKGLCSIDSDKIFIYDNEDKESYTFYYSLKENKLKLNYSNGSLTLKRN